MGVPEPWSDHLEGWQAGRPRRRKARGDVQREESLLSQVPCKSRTAAHSVSRSEAHLRDVAAHARRVAGLREGPAWSQFHQDDSRYLRPLDSWREPASRQSTAWPPDPHTSPSSRRCRLKIRTLSAPNKKRPPKRRPKSFIFN